MNKLTHIDGALMGVSESAKHFWGAAIEGNLPKPTITEDISILTPSLLLMDILQYARGAESRGEWLFRKNYLHPLLTHFTETNGITTSWHEDDMGNMYCTVGNPNGVLHVGHIDTIHDEDHSPLQDITIDASDVVSLTPIAKNSVPDIKQGVRWVDNVDVKYDYINYSLPPKQTRSLGADDGCAVAIMLYLIANEIEGTYLFTRGEEVGCIGTHYIIDNGLLDWSQFKIAIEVDRKGTTDIVGNMSVGNTASQSFVSSLALQLGMGHKMAKGTITDVGHIAEFVPECVNIAAGYLLQHSERETTDLRYIDRLGKAMLTLDYSALNIVREAGNYYPKVTPTTHKPYTPNYSNSWQGYSTSRNSYGDYGKEPETLTESLKDTYDTQHNALQLEVFVRSNAGFISEFLLALDISPKQMHNIICFGNVDGVEDIALPDETIID